MMWSLGAKGGRWTTNESRINATSRPQERGEITIKTR